MNSAINSILPSWLAMLTVLGLFSFPMLVFVDSSPGRLQNSKIQRNRSFSWNGSSFNPPARTLVLWLLVDHMVNFVALICVQWCFVQFSLGGGLDRPESAWEWLLSIGPAGPAQSGARLAIAIAITALGTLIGGEIGFYFVHRLLHWAPLYKKIHKKHHEFAFTIAAAAAYAHPCETVLNIGALYWPLFALGVPGWLAGVFTFYGFLSTSIHHSGFRDLVPRWCVCPWPLFLVPQPEFHDWHHSQNTGNFGVTGHLDWLFGTDMRWRKRKRS